MKTFNVVVTYYLEVYAETEDEAIDIVNGSSVDGDDIFTADNDIIIIEES